ncbi:MAG TPA: 3-hydroxyacyl-CoA dehydrogenase family protein [Blastocatellia bacterium]|nr:3-hydroxyacyl-CoA dehydrogenase family protein [Blastocatellia bacterium]
MGHGIAQVAAQAGFEVSLADVSDELVQDGLNKIRSNLKKAVELGKLSELDAWRVIEQITPTTDFEDLATGADLIVEAIVEKMDVKRGLFKRLGEVCTQEAILATNTSSLSVTEIASAAVNPGRVIGMHFFNPPHIMKLIEVVVASQTSDHTLTTVLEVAQRMGKEAITVKDSPGFATSRLGLALGLEAMRMLEEGVASAEDIDKAMMLGYNHPVGPLKLTDLVGLDVRLSIAEYLSEEFKTERFRPPDILRRKVAEGKFGKKTGEGFYKW